MRSLHHGIWLLVTVVPVAFASCSSDEGGSANQDGGGSSDAGSPGHAGNPDAAGTSHGGERGDAGSGSGGRPNVGDGGDPNVGEGGAINVGDGGSPDVGEGGEPNGGAGAGHAGAPSGGSGGEAGAPAAELPAIVLFDAGPHNGLNFGGRVGLDQHCASAKQNLEIAGAFTHALISVSDTDELRDMPVVYGLPTNRAFVGPTGEKVADDFADLLDGDIDQSLSDAEISDAQFWITGSNADGSVRKTCNGWTTSDFSQQVTGSYGYPGSNDSSWLTVTGGDVYCSASQYNVICVAYD